MMLMKNHLLTWVIVLCIASLSLHGCNNTTDNGEHGNNGNGADTAQVDDNDGTTFSDDDYSGKQYGLPSPFQVAALIQKSGFNYAPELLNPKTKYKDYLDNYSRSLNLGVYGTDLGYAAMFEQSQDALDYLNTTKALADELGILGAFEKSTMERIQDNLGNRDSLLRIVAESFSKSDEYLKQSDRNVTSALILAGGWIEALYLSTQLTVNKKDEEVVNRIGEQKISLNILLLLLNQFKEENVKIQTLITELESLREIYRNVEIQYIYAEPTTDAGSQTTTVNTTSEVIISDETLGKITDTIASIRNSIVN